MEKKYCYFCMRGEHDPTQPCINCHSGETPQYAAHQLKPGTVLHEKYLIGQVIGQGGFGITYIGRDLTLDMRVAIKEYYPINYVIRNNAVANLVDYTKPQNHDQFENGIDRFLTEARTLAKFNQEPGIVSVRDFFRENKTAYIVMDYLDGITLKEYLEMHEKIPAKVILPMMYPIMDSLSKIHDLHHIHRDISPDNIMVLKNGTLVLLDFGASKEIDGAHSLSVVLKPGYAPEEQYRRRGNQGAWTDVYALAATIYHCITGIVPDESLQRIYEDELVDPRELGAEITKEQSDALMCALNIHPQDRFQSMESFKLALSGKKVSGEEIRSIFVDRDKRTIDEEELKQRSGRKAGPTVEDPEKENDEAAKKAAAEQKRKQELAAKLAAKKAEREAAEKKAAQDAARKAEAERKQAEREATKKALEEKLAAQIAERARKKAEQDEKKRLRKEISKEKALRRAASLRILGKVALIIVIISALIGTAYGVYSLLNVRICGTNYMPNETYISLIDKTLTKEDVEALSRIKTLEYLSLDRCDVSALNGLGEMKKLNALTLKDCKDLDSIGFIRKMPMLDMFSLEGCNLSRVDMQPIAEKVAFGALKLSGCSLKDASFLESLDHIVALDLSDNAIEKIDLSGLSAVGSLNINYNPCKKISLPASVTEFYADETGLMNLRSLKGQESLSILSLRNNGITDISVLSGMTELKHLYLDGNGISDISALSGLTKLQTLAMNGNQVENLNALRELIYLTEVRFGRNVLTDISGLENCTRLATIQLDGNGLSDVSILGKSAKYIQHLYLSDNAVSDISFLGESEKLIFLDADRNMISDMSWLDSAKTDTLRGLSLAGNKISHNYFNFPELRYIDLSDNEFEESIDLSLGRKLSYVDISGSNYRSLIANFDTTGVTFIADGTPLEQIVTSGVEHFNYVVLTNNPLLFNGIDYSLSRVPGSSIAFSYSREWGRLDHIPQWNYMKFYAVDPPLDCIADLEDASSNKLETASSAEAILMEARRHFSDDVFLIYPY